MPTADNGTDGFDTEHYDEGYRWIYQSPGGAFFAGPKLYKSRGSALRAGRAWLAAQERT